MRWACRGKGKTGKKKTGWALLPGATEEAGKRGHRGRWSTRSRTDGEGKTADIGEEIDRSVVTVTDGYDYIC